MKAYQAEVGCYGERYTDGRLFDCPERAMAQFKGNWRKTVWTHHPDWPDTTKVEHWVSWDNDLDWGDAVTITEVDASIITTGPLAPPAPCVVQTLNASGGWDYVPETETVETPTHLT